MTLARSTLPGPPGTLDTLDLPVYCKRETLYLGTTSHLDSRTRPTPCTNPGTDVRCDTAGGVYLGGLPTRRCQIEPMRPYIAQMALYTAQMTLYIAQMALYTAQMALL